MKRQPAVRIRDHPGEVRKAPRRVVDRRHGQVDTDGVDRSRPRHGVKRIARPAAQIHHDGPIRESEGDDESGHFLDERASHAGCEQAGPRGDHLRGVARGERPPILRLQQVHVAAARDVVRVSARTAVGRLTPVERQPAVAHGAREDGAHTVRIVRVRLKAHSADRDLKPDATDNGVSARPGLSSPASA